MIIAVAYDAGNIGEHFGHAEMFALYDYPNYEVEQCTKRLIDCSDRHGHAAMAELMRENKVDMVLVGRMGPEAKSMLLSFGIVPVVGYCGDADTAADLLITGQLPLDGMEAESCGGGCGGCGGGCCGGDDADGGSCGCGGGCCGE